MADPKKAAIAAAYVVSQIGSKDWNDFCQRLVEQAYGTSGQFPTALAAGNALNPKKALEGAKVGDLVLFSADDSNNGAGHAGIYLGNGTFVGAQGGQVSEVKNFLNNPYWAARFRGVAEAPDAWQGRAATPELEKGAQELIARATGATNVAETPTSAKLTALQREARDLQARLTQSQTDLRDAPKAMSLVPAYRKSKTPDAQWLPANGVTKAEMDRLIAVYDRYANDVGEIDATKIRQQVTQDENALRTLNIQIGDAEDDARTAAGKTAPASAADPKGTKRTKLHAFPDGNQYVVTEVADGAGNWLTDTTAPPQPYGPQKAASAQARRTQVVGQNLIDLDTGAVITQLPAAAQNKRTQVVGTKLIDLDTGQPIADLTDALAKPANEQPENVSAPTNQPKLVRRAPTGELLTEDNPNYQAPAAQNYGDPRSNYNAEVARLQAQLQLKAGDLQKRLDLDPTKADDYRQELQSWWAQNTSHLTGLRSAAERQVEIDRLAQETAQRTENTRAETVNRQREQTAYQAGQTMREKAAALTPGVRSPQFMDKYAQSINAFGGKTAAPEWSTADFRPGAGQIPDLNAMAEMETARALAAISPSAAARIGAPLPDLAAMPDLNSVLPRFQLPAQGA